MASTTHAKIVKLLNKKNSLVGFCKKEKNNKIINKNRKLKSSSYSIQQKVYQGLSGLWTAKKNKVSNAQKFCGDHYNVYIKSWCLFVAVNRKKTN